MRNSALPDNLTAPRDRDYKKSLVSKTSRNVSKSAGAYDNIQYSVSVANYGSFVFDHWQDTNSTVDARSVNIA